MSAPDHRELSKAQARLEKQVARAEADIAAAETRIRSRDQELADPALYQNFSQWHTLHQEQTRWKQDLDRMTAKWESLSQELEDVRKKLSVRREA